MAIDNDAVTPGTTPGPAAWPEMAGGSVAATYRHLVLVAGLRPREAASLVGRLEGLPMVPGGWTLGEVRRLLFVRALVASGRVGS